MEEIAIQTIDGFQIGHSQDVKAATGCTSIVCAEGAVGGVDVRGSAPATRETDLLHPLNMAESVHCVMLSGGSAFGLAAADGAMAYLRERDIGFATPGGLVPIVVGASLFDLVLGANDRFPDREMGYAALVASEQNDGRTGNIGAGIGASVGKILGMERAMKSGLGMCAAAVGPVQVGAIVVVNAFGNIVDPANGQHVAGLLGEDGRTIISSEAVFSALASDFNAFHTNTTIGCIITNAILTKAQVNKVASMAHDGFARTIYPVHTSADGDTVFALTNNKVEAPPDLIGIVAAQVMSRAILNAIDSAESAYGLKCAKDLI